MAYIHSQPKVISVQHLYDNILFLVHLKLTLILSDRLCNSQLKILQTFYYCVQFDQKKIKKIWTILTRIFNLVISQYIYMYKREDYLKNIYVALSSIHDYENMLKCFLFKN